MYNQLQKFIDTNCLINLSSYDEIYLSTLIKQINYNTFLKEIQYYKYM